MNAPTTGWNSGSMGTSDPGRRFGLTITVLVTLGALVLSGIVALAIMLSASVPQPASVPSPVEAPAPVPSASAPDPYAVYLRNAPADAPQLSREDAQARAYLGCGMTFAPGTVDAILAEAYEGICK